MLELIFSALITVLPDYLYRRYVQGKRFGYEITLYTFWYELRWGITACVASAVTLITVIFYYHPTTSHVVSLFRTVSIISDRAGRVEEVYVRNNEAGEVDGIAAFALRLVDGMGIANALVVRAQALLLPIRAIVFPG